MALLEQRIILPISRSFSSSTKRKIKSRCSDCDSFSMIFAKRSLLICRDGEGGLGGKLLKQYWGYDAFRGIQDPGLRPASPEERKLQTGCQGIRIPARFHAQQRASKERARIPNLLNHLPDFRRCNHLVIHRHTVGKQG